MTEQLDTDSLLLLYLFDELSPEDRAAVEARIASDPALAEQLKQLRGLDGAIEATLKSADAHPLPMTADTAVRRVSRAMKQWHADQARRAALAPLRPQFRLPAWSYASAVAAAIIIGVLLWARSLPDAGETRLTARQLAEQQAQLAEQLEVDLAEGYGNDFDGITAVATLDATMSPEQDFDSIFMRQGSW